MSRHPHECRSCGGYKLHGPICRCCVLLSILAAIGGIGLWEIGRWLGVWGW